jgi:hypothetical protein
MTRNEQFLTRVQMVAQYAQINGHADIPLNHDTRDVNGRRIALGRWASYIKSRYRAGLLTVEQAQAFEIVPSWDWEARTPGAKINVTMHREVHTYRGMRMSLQQIADRVGLSRQRVHQILKGNAK